VAAAAGLQDQFLGTVPLQDMGKEAVVAVVVAVVGREVPEVPEVPEVWQTLQRIIVFL
tara:strand:- start:1477 stop:1650 length:174 start_codon:yes stop_codon:yes gene_type:complete